jgi:ubiquinone/menaquinone biosynthesis C-methylase UbiE
MEWGAGRYERIAEQLLGAAEVVVEQATPREGERVVDIGCETGNAALLAAERGATVTGVDPAQRLLDVAASTAAERGLNATFTIGEAADIPVEDNGLDVALSVFGVIFAPDPEAAAAEINRVTARAGRVLLAAWLPEEGGISQAVRFTRQTLAEVLGQPPASPPFAWHELESLSGLFEPYGFTPSLTEHALAWAASSVDEFMQIEGEKPSARDRGPPRARRGWPHGGGARGDAPDLPRGQRGPGRLPDHEPLRRGRDGAQSVAGDDPVVVEPHQLDHIPDVLVGLDPARGRTRLVREDGMVDDAPLLLQGGADLLAEAEVGGVVAVKVADLVAVDVEAELTALSVSGLDTVPRCDLFGDSLAG